MDPSDKTPSDDTRPIVLVIDDEVGPRESIRFLLKEDYRVLCAPSVENGVALVREYAPDIVIMDIRMPGRNGIDGLREIREIDSDVAVVMLTGFAAVGTAQEAIRYEASDYMEKPFDAMEMINVVRRHMDQTRLRRKRTTLLKEAEALNQRIRDLQSKERWVELGQSSAEFIHDLRNMLALVSTSSGVLRDELESLQQQQIQPSPEAGFFLDTLETGMQRCVDMLDTWQRLIRQTPEQLTRFSLHDLVRACVEAQKPAAQVVHAALTCETLGKDNEWLGDHVQLARVIDNLVQNAIHALPGENGLVHVRLERRPSSARIDVSDNGCGIAEENLRHIFSPDFTTRRSLGGMGLGLFIAQKVAQTCGGALTVQSTLGKGSTFTLELPELTEKAKPAAGAD